MDRLAFNAAATINEMRMARKEKPINRFDASKAKQKNLIGFKPYLIH